MKKPYTLFKRSNGVYYVRFRDQNGERLTAVSTGSTRKSEAEVFAIDYLRQGKVDPKRSDSFRNYTKNFFDYGTSKYIKNEHRCGRSYGRRYADENKTILEKHLLPVWGDKSLSKITPVEIENYLFDVAEKYSSSRVCGIRNAIACIFKEAYHEGIIEVNPMDRVSKITARIPEKGIYSDEVIEKLFKGDALSSVWKNNRFHYVLNYLAYSTGMRQGELLALMPENIQEDRILVKYNWERKFGLKDPKYKSNRVVPLNKDAYLQVKRLIEERHTLDGQFVFAGDIPTVPIDHRAVNRRLTAALERVGMLDEERKAKNLTFHSWRHTFTTRMKGRVPDYLLRLLTGHKSAAMSDHYTHYNFDSVKAALPIQEEVFALPA